MRLITFLLLAFVLSVSANSYSQNTKLSLTLEDVSIVEIFEFIESNSEFVFLYKNEDLDINRKLSVDLKKATIDEVLNKVLDKQDVKYRIYDRQIVISQGKTVLEYSNNLQQERTVTGIVTSASGEPLPGVTILVKGATTGTTTGNDGGFTLKLPDGAETLVFSFIGMVTQEIPLEGKTVINVILEEDIQGLEEVIVVGYGTQKKINMTGAVEMVSGETIKDRAVPNVGKALQGVIPNLNITVTTSGGEPGASQDINIRGMGSINGGGPYILVDGVPMSLDFVNPSDIESVTVLKDAASSAIYGSRAPYGVILITTKSGKMGEKTSIKYNTYFSFDSQINQPESMSSLEWANAANYASDNAGTARLYSEDDISLINQYLNGEITDELEVVEGENQYYGAWSNNDYSDIFYKDVVMTQKHDIQMSSGTDKSSIFASAGYYDEDGALLTGKEGFKRYNLNMKANTKVNSWLSLNFNVKYSRSIQTSNQGYSNYNRSVIYHEITKLKPNEPAFTPDGRAYHWILRKLEFGGIVNTEKNDFWSTIGFELEPVKNWVTKVNYNWNSYSQKDIDQTKDSKSPLPDGTYVGSIGPGNFIKETLYSNNYHMFNATTSYLKSLGKHNMKVLFGYEEEVRHNFNLYGSKQDQLLPDFPSISTSTGDQVLDDNISHWATQGVFGRFTYNYNQKYLLEVNARYDGSSRFEDGSRWGLFPSASVGYNIHKENFWSVIKPYVNTLKLRASYGSLGNQNVANYLYIASIPVKTNLPWIMNGVRPMYAQSPNLVSNNLTWEISTTQNLGVDATFLNNRLSTSFDIWKRNTTDMFGPAEGLPAGLGTSPPKANNAELETKGFELLVTWKDMIGNVHYNVRVVLADNISTVKKYNNPTGILSNWYEGEVIGDIWGYTSEKLFETDEEATAHTDEIDQSRFYSQWQAGDVKYIDLDDSKKIDNGANTVDDHGDLTIIGNNRARYTFGLNLGLEWKGLDFNMFWQGVAKRDIYFNSGSNAFWGIVSDFNQSSSFKHGLDFWTEDNKDAYFPRPYFSNQNNKNRQTQTMYLRNAAYARLKNIVLGYTVPSSITSKIKLSGVRVYMSVENLITISSLNGTIDPEAINGAWGVGKLYPLQRTISFGANINF